MIDFIHTKFISTPISDILEEATDACSILDPGIENQPLSEYILQTTFLKMTGASEQKLKCICWEMASRDYAYRYSYTTGNTHGECSSYKDKNDIYKELIEQIKNIDSTFQISTFFDNKQKIINDIKTDLYNILTNSCIETWVERGIQLSKAQSSHDFITASQLKLDEKNLFESSLIESYTTIVYKHRNRCAHNLKSFQNNLPTLRTLEKTTYVFENYFYRYLLLILIDNIFIKLYKEYNRLSDIIPK